MPATRCYELRTNANRTKFDLAYASGVSLGVIDRLEAARHPADLECMYVGSFIAVARALRVRPSDLYPVLGGHQ